jgi:hypothetical protein
MTTRCCEDYSCPEITPAKCIKYTGTQPADSVLHKEYEGCNPNMQEVTLLYNNHITDLLAKGGISVADLKAANDVCGLNLLNLANVSTYHYNDKRYVEGEVVIQLIGALCEVSKRLNYLMNESNTTKTNIFWLDLPLNGKLDLKCLIDDPCFGVSGPQTLKALLQAMINKLCA